MSLPSSRLTVALIPFFISLSQKAYILFLSPLTKSLSSMLFTGIRFIWQSIPDTRCDSSSASWPAMNPQRVTKQQDNSYPMEEYWMSDDYVKVGYGKSAIFTHFRKAEALTVCSDHFEIVEKGKNRHIYVPSEDIGFVESYIMERLPQSSSVRRTM